MQRGSPLPPAAAARGFVAGVAPWRRRLSRGWRIARTGLGFGLAGLLSVFLAFVVFPVLRLASGSPERMEIPAQKAIHRFTRAYFRIVSALGMLRIHCHGGERLRAPGILVVANHPTLIDALVLMSLMPQADCVVKESYYANPILRGAARGAGYLNNRAGPEIVEQCADRLRSGRSVIIFPEGTRSPVHDLGPFARGAAHVALRAGCSVVPVTIHCDPATLCRDQAWWDVPDRAFDLTLSVGDPLIVQECVDDEMNLPQAARTVTNTLYDHFKRRLAVV